MALQNNGTIWCWGKNGSGQLGNGDMTYSNSNVAVQTGTISNVVAISAGAFHALALKNDGTLWAWGSNLKGELGVGAENGTATVNPVQVSGITGTITALSGGYWHSMALTSSGSVWTWGDNADGQLGMGTTTGTNVPVQVSSLSGINKIVAGSDSFHALAVKSDGTVWAWGDNTDGQLGAGSYGSIAGSSPSGSALPVQVVGLSGTITSIISGEFTTVALTSTGTVVQWGNTSYQPIAFSVPVQQTNVAATPAPTINSNGGFYSSEQNVGISTGISGGVIRYTLDGTDPNSSSSTYTGIFSLSSSALVKAAVFSSNGVQLSAISNSQYYIGVTPTIAVSGSGQTALAGSFATMPLVVKVENTSGLILPNAAVTFAITSGPGGLASVSGGNAFSSISTQTGSNGEAWVYFGGPGSAGSTSVTVTVGGQSATFTETLSNPSSAPTFSPAAGTYSTTQTVTLSSTTPGATIYYTTNGTMPTTASTSFSSSGTITVSHNEMVEAITSASGYNDSSVATSRYWIGSTDIQVADSFAMTRKIDGTVWTWGDNGRGQQGDNQAEGQEPHPQQLTRLGNVALISAAGDHALTLKNDGSVWAWGANDQSQGGNGGTSDLLIPTQVSGLSNVAKIYAGPLDGFALDYMGDLYAWGQNNQGQLGDGSTTNSTTPELITGISGVTKVASGANFTAALKSDGSVWATGDNSVGELGTNTGLPAVTFQEIPGLSNIVDIAVGGYHAVAIKSDGTVWTWGVDWNGQLGDGNFGGGTSTPEEVSLPGPAMAVIAVDVKTYVILADGTVRCFGGNGEGEMGIGNNQDQSLPVEPTGISNVVSLAAGTFDAMVRTTSGAYSGWGDNFDFQLTQDFTTFSRNTEVHDDAYGNFTQVASANTATLALKNDGTVWAVGEGGNGLLGQGGSDWLTHERFVQVSGLSGVAQVSAGDYIAFAIDNSHVLWAWGANWDGQLGIGNNDTQNAPVQVEYVTNVIAATGGEGHMLAVQADGSVWASGDNSNKELGDGTSIAQNAPIEIMALVDSGVTAKAVAAGNNTSFALDSNGTVWAWGRNDSGELGLGTTGDVGTPTAITGLPTMVAISARQTIAMGIDSSGNVWSWGAAGNSDGTPVMQTLSYPAVAVAAGQYHLLALDSTGVLWGWGGGGLGQLGNGSYSDQAVPVQIDNDTEPVTSIAASNVTSYLIKQDGSFTGFGYCSPPVLGSNLGVYNYSPKPLFGIAANETPPTVSISLPSSSATSTSGSAISFQSSASASTGSITEVDYYLDGVNLGASTTPGTWNFSYTPVSSGSYSFEAVAYDTAGVAQISAPEIIAVSAMPPTAPSGLTVTPGGSGTVYLSWTNNATDATSLLIQQQNPNGSWSTIATLANPTDVAYAITMLDSSQSYNFQVVAVNRSGTGIAAVSYATGTTYAPAVIAKINGDPPTIATSTFESGPLTVEVTSSTGVPLINVPVTFTIPSGSNGNLALTNGGTTYSTLTVSTNAQGQANAYYRTGSDTVPNDMITATASSGAANPSVNFYYGLQSGLAAWLSADKNVSVNGSNQVTQWVDQGPNHYVLTPASSSNKPTLVETADSHAAVQFSSGQALATASGISSLNAVTVISVTPQGNGVQVDLRSGAFGFGYAGGAQALFYHEGGDIETGPELDALEGGTYPSPSEPWQVSDYEYAIATNTVGFYAQGGFNGTFLRYGLDFDGAGFSTLSVGSPATTLYNPGDFAGWSGNIAEVLVYDHVLTDAERDIVDQYLSTKYNVILIHTPASISYNTGDIVNYQIPATDSPTTYSAAGLPPGLGLDSTTGVITGTPLVSGTYTTIVAVSNATTAATATLNFTINPAPGPMITPNGGSYSSFAIAPDPTNSSATIHYTLDGTAPTSNSPSYTSTVALTRSCPVSCAYFSGDSVVSAIGTAQFYVGDSGDIGISDAWQIEYFGYTGIDPNAQSVGGSGLTNLQAYLYGYNPTFYSTNGDGLSDLVNHEMGYAGNNYDINGYGLTNAQQLALGLDPFDSGVNPAQPTPPSGTPGDTTPPTITLTSPQDATLSP